MPIKYCRNCCSKIKKNNKICHCCGENAFSGSNYCRGCGRNTTDREVMCIKCGQDFTKTQKSKPKDRWYGFYSKNIYRSKDENFLLGTISGLAHKFKLPKLLLRFLFVLIFFLPWHYVILFSLIYLFTWKFPAVDTKI